ncbi:MAG: methionyl-tRNA formyltransferase [Deltaproteobacteria bacterium]|jgi:methionyl-tRNA formyltransferase|nr:methionyl-tRNA formyltransferase [Deltaproteobacteria bacterium]
MSKVRILFMGTPDFARTALQSMLEDEHFEIAAVVTQPDRPAGRKMQLTPSPVKKLALEKGLTVLTPETVNTEFFRDQVQGLAVESAVVVAFGQLLGDAFLALFPKGAVNVHGSLLPKWRGAAPIQRSIMAGDTETGVALQIVVKKLDAGPVLGVRRIPLNENETATEVYPRLAQLGCELLSTEYMDYLRGNLTPVAQDESRVSHAAKIKKSEAAIDWNCPAHQIVNLVRGLALGPVPHARRADGASFKVHRAVCATVGAGQAARGAHKPPGTVLGVSESSIDVLAGDGAVVRLMEVQPESRARLTLKDYLHGYAVSIGEVFLAGSIAGQKGEVS